MSATVEIDGAFGEGGGQILRTSVALAALTGRATIIRNIRAGRPKPGLAAQHLASVRAAAELCGAGLAGDAVGSQYLEIHPKRAVQPGAYRFPIGTAGATALVGQTVAVPLALAGASQVTIYGGTHVPFAPSACYLADVYAPALADLGLHLAVDTPKAGFFPKGGGELRLTLAAGSPTAIDWVERGKLTQITAIALTSGLEPHVAERGLKAMRAQLQGVGRPVTLENRPRPGEQGGAAVLVAGSCQRGHFGFLALGQRGKPIEKVAEEATAAFWAWFKTDAATEEHLADQLVLPLALAEGESRWTTQQASLHLETVLWVARHYLPIRYDIQQKPDGSALVTLQGAG
ncbi:MAG: 3-terminal-phosphate cyclase [Cyanobacteria bacterium RYN_339]|nr:3-terminal-phosphate cyclase [Cyanobacteria bacterium RYN_339]